jgi:osmotically-inducible protein OsmY
VARDRAKPPEANAEPDNTAVNTRDRNRETREPKLPIDQKETQHDVDLTAKIRQRVLASEGMSVNARNVKIITADGKVTLRGPVESSSERETIAKIARELAGDSNVDDQIEVKSTSSSTSSSPNP